MKTGRILRSLATVPPGGDELLAAQATRAGRMFLTATSGPYCQPRYRGDMECPKFEANSCHNTVATFSPGQDRFRGLFTVPGSETIGEAVPNSAGTQVALSIEPCLGLHVTNGLFVRDLKTGASRPVVTSGNRCDSYGPAAWNPAGTELAFPFEPAGKPVMTVGGVACPQEPEYLALAPARGVGTVAHLKLISAGRGCAFGAVAFDESGFVAVKGCSNGGPKGYYDSNLGHAYLLQYTPSGRLQLRIPLKLGMEQAVMASVPGTNDVLITQDQPANQPYPERDWVWEFNGHAIRLIARYPAEDADQVLAVPW